MTCHCIPPPASLKPRKTYKFLLEDVYSSVTDTDIGDPITISTKSRIGKLQQYVHSNPAKAPKVSSKLNKQVKKDLSARRLGLVKVSVYAYCDLLDQSTAENSTYTFSFFNKELIHQPDCIIHTLLTNSNQQVQALGAHLLTSYLNAQTEVEHQASADAELVRKVLELSQGAKQAPGAGVAGSQEELQAECLRTLQAYVKLCHKIKILPDLLEKIEVDLLDSMAAKMSDRGSGVQGPVDSVQGDGSQAAAGPPDAAAILKDFSPFLQDGSSVRRVIGTLLQWLDAKGLWADQMLVQKLVELVRDACGSNTYPLSASLLRHCAAGKGLTPAQRGTAARLSVHKGSGYSLSILNLALLELPRALAAAEASGGAAAQQDLAALHTTAQEVCIELSHEVGDVVQVCGALATVLRAQLMGGGAQQVSADPAAPAPPPADDQVKQHTLRCGLAVARELKAIWSKAHVAPSRSLSPSLLSALSAVLTPGSSTDAASQVALRPLALQLLTCLLGPDVKDERQAAQLLSAAAAGAEVLEVPSQQSAVQESGSVQGLNLGLNPLDVQAATQVMSAALSSMKPPLVVQGAQLALDLAQRAAALLGPGGEVGQGKSLQAAVYALLAQSCMHLLGRPGAPPAYARLTQIQVLPSGLALPSLKLQPDGCLGAARPAWAADDLSAAAAAGPQLQAGLKAWRDACVQVIKTEGVLPAEHVSALDAYLQAPMTSLQGPAPQSAARSLSGNLEPAAGGRIGSLLDPTRRRTGYVSRQMDVKRERVMIQKVMDMLGSDDDEGKQDPASSPAAPGAGVSHVDIAMSVKPGVQLGGGSVRVATSLRQVMELAAAEVQKAGAAGLPGAGVPEEPSLKQLMAQIDPLSVR